MIMAGTSRSWGWEGDELNKSLTETIIFHQLIGCLTLWVTVAEGDLTEGHRGTDSPGQHPKSQKQRSATAINYWEALGNLDND